MFFSNVYSLAVGKTLINNSYLKKPIQKIIYIKSQEEIEIYKNLNKNNTWLIKFNNNKNLTDKVEIFVKDKLLFNNYFNKNNITFKNFLNDVLYKKKLINITPGGILGYYDTGICKVIKKKYMLNNYIFTGASAGSWNSLFMSYKHSNIDKIINKIFEINIDNIKNIKELQQNLKKKILDNFKTEDFDLDKIFISVCVYDNYDLNNYIYTNFKSLENAIDCCIASSNIPFLTGDLFHRFENKISFDGGFLNFPHLIIKKPILKITNSLWGRKRIFTSLFDKINNNIVNLYNEGINDTIKNISILDELFYQVVYEKV
jgi:hypothetical protein